MEALKFRLRGKTAFFKNPEVNSYYYFTFGQIHKPALIGIFGAVMGYKGYESKYDDYPEYYEKLKDIKIAVVPESENGYFPKKIQVFNNSVGYASQEEGGNLVVKEQWLENPSWIVYLMIDGDISKRLAQMIYERKCVYMPYLGKNDHPAVIEDSFFVSLMEKEGDEIQSLIPQDYISSKWDSFTFKYEEYLPAELKLSTNQYIMKKFYFTDEDDFEIKEQVFNDGQRNIVFF